MNDLQVENGNFTRIVNPLIEELIKIPFKGCELAVAMYIIRKTYGFQKKQDEISLTQFQNDLKRSRQTIVTALKNLQLVDVARLVKRGNMKGDSNIWTINKYHDSWKLVNMARLVKRKRGASLAEGLNLVKPARHTKEITKETKDKRENKFSPEGAILLKAFESLNPSCKKFYGNTTQRKALDELISTFGFERIKLVIEKTLPRTNGLQYFPTITTPLQLQDKWVALESAIRKHQSEKQEKDKKYQIIR